MFVCSTPVHCSVGNSNDWIQSSTSCILKLAPSKHGCVRLGGVVAERERRYPVLHPIVYLSHILGECWQQTAHAYAAYQPCNAPPVPSFPGPAYFAPILLFFTLGHNYSAVGRRLQANNRRTTATQCTTTIVRDLPGLCTRTHTSQMSSTQPSAMTNR
jgi:hypothetical protein